MFRKYVYNKVTWFDFKHPRSSEVVAASESYGIPEDIVQSFLSSHTQSDAFVSGDVIFLALPFPVQHDSGYASTSIRFIIGHNFIFTAREIESKAFRDASKKVHRGVHTNSISSKNASLSLEPLRDILSKLYIEIGNNLEELQHSFTEAEHAVNHQHNYYKNIIENQSETWKVFDSLCSEFFDHPDSTKSLESISEHYKDTMQRFDVAPVTKKMSSEARKKRSSLFSKLRVFRK